jgi:hypothetical protein
MDRACNTQGGNTETTRKFGYKTIMENIISRHLDGEIKTILKLTLDNYILNFAARLRWLSISGFCEHEIL